LLVHRSRTLLAASLLASLAAVALPTSGIGVAHAAVSTATKTKHVDACKHVRNTRSHCLAIRVDRVHAGRIRHAASPVGYTPSDLQSAYSLPSSTHGSGETVAIVDAYDAPTAEHDLKVYRSQFHLRACTTANGCFRKVDQTGGHDYPDHDGGWAQEISLDLDMVSAVCPDCHVLLVEAKTASMANLGAAEDTAVRLGADAVSNSYGGADATDSSYGRFFHHPGVAVTASSGDNGYGVSYPASSKWVTAVGGTTLSKAHNARGFTETAWAGTGSGCSTKNKTSWQSSSLTGCSGRAMSDVAAVADPSTGVAVYDSDSFEDTSGWLTFGGTSASSPIIAATYALAGNTGQVKDGSFVWAHHSGLHDVTRGTNGSCSTTRWCTARRGWDGPTGWGSPHGVAGF
jgi:subtilase family serine protease